MNPSNTHIFLRIIKRGVPAVITITALSGLVYLAVQQDMRQGANDPQIQMAEDAANALSDGVQISVLVPASKIDVVSLSPFIIVFDKNGDPIASSGELRGKIPVPPKGVFSYAKKYMEDRVTWQPEPEVRIASIIHAYEGVAGSGFVLVGRNMREVEVREDQLTKNVGLAWIVTVIACLISIAMSEKIFASV